MSSISSGVDLSVKYQRLSAEYVKIRNQVAVLKKALLDEQSKTAELQQQILQKNNQIRTKENEKESLTFRNDQLVKRVENLQESLETQLAPFCSIKGKKKHKEANLRLIAESRMSHQQTLAGSSASGSDPQILLEEELERKITENSELHSKLFDIERRFDEATAEFMQRINALEEENSSLKSSRSSDGKPSDSAISLDSAEPIDTEDEEVAAKRKLLDEYYTDRISTLTKSLQHATGRATYYKQECEELIRRSIYEQNEIVKLQKKLQEFEDKWKTVNDTLEATQQNYTEQMKQLYEHMAGQDAKIAEQADMLIMQQKVSVFNSNNNTDGITDR